MNAWLRFGDGAEPAERAVREVQLHRLCGRQHRRADGRLVPQGDQDRRRPEGPENAHRRLRRHDPVEARRGAAAARRAATSIRRWRRARSTPPNGSAPMTTRSSASTRSRRTTTIRAGGKAAARATTSSTSPSGTSCRRHYQSMIQVGLRRGLGLGDRQVRLRQSGRRSRGCISRRRAAAAVPAGRSWRPATRPRRKSMRSTSKTNADVQEDATTAWSPFRNDSYRLAAGRRTRLRQLHDAHAHAHLSVRRVNRRKRRGPGALLRGLLLCRRASRLGGPKSRRRRQVRHLAISIC